MSDFYLLAGSVFFLLVSFASDFFVLAVTFGVVDEAGALVDVVAGLVEERESEQATAEDEQDSAEIKELRPVVERTILAATHQAVPEHLKIPTLFLELDVIFVILLALFLKNLPFLWRHELAHQHISHLLLRNASVDETNVLELSLPGNVVAHASHPEAEQGDVQQEEEERFEGEVSDAVIGPWAVVVHGECADSTGATVVNSFNLYASTFLAF